jgi:hypothetical protein
VPDYERAQSPVEQADRALDAIPMLRDISKIPPNQCWVVCRSMMAPIYVSSPVTQTVTLTDKPQVVTFPISPETTPIAQVLQPPNGTVIYGFEETDERRQIHGMFLGAKRVRNCLAFLAEVPVPIRYAFASQRILWRESYNVEMIMRYHPEIRGASDEAKREWFSHLEGAFGRAEELLRRIPPMSPLGRAISLVGDAIWSSDIEESFLYAWRAVDVAAKEDFSAVRRLEGGDRERALERYTSLAADEVSAENHWRGPSVSTRIRVTVANRANDVGDEKTKEFNKLRGAIAHDTVDVDQFRRVLENRWEAIHIARRVVESAIGDTAH